MAQAGVGVGDGDGDGIAPGTVLGTILGLVRRGRGIAHGTTHGTAHGTDITTTGMLHIGAPTTIIRATVDAPAVHPSAEAPISVAADAPATLPIVPAPPVVARQAQEATMAVDILMARLMCRADAPAMPPAEHPHPQAM